MRPARAGGANSERTSTAPQEHRDRRKCVVRIAAQYINALLSRPTLKPTSLSLRLIAVALAALLPLGAARAASPAAQSSPLVAASADAVAITALMDKGQWAQALERADAVIKTRPRDLQVRFQRAVILAELSRTADAIAVYEGLIQDFPELPEPYNNLGVLYAAQGNYGAAYDQLQKALLAMPGYATAHENLGDLHIAMAVDDYQKAAKLDPKSRTVPAKLSAARELASRVRAVR
jgi:Flp pilus assembly protein TadD